MALRYAYWTDQEDAQLRKLVAAGLTYGQIAHRMAERSRCSIIGRVSRLKRDGLL